MGVKPYKHLPLIISICLVAAIGAVYWPVHNYDFIKYDDDTYVTDNTNIQSGLNFKSIRWAFAATHASNWHPLTWLSPMLDCQLFGNRAGGYHIVKVLFYILNNLILFYVLKIMK